MDDKTPQLTPELPDAPEAETATPVATGKRSFVSAGEHAHKWSTYLGIDWLFNAVTGVSFAYWGKHTETGQKYWSKPITGFFTKVLKPFIKDAEALEKSAGHGNMFMSIIAGGMFTIPPLLILENNHNKRKITEFFDKAIHGKEAVENDPKFQKAYEEIEQAPKKDFWNGLWSRFAALSPLLAMVLYPKTKAISNKYWFNHVEKGSESTFKALGLNAEKMFKHSSPAVAQEKWKFVHESVAMDFGLGIPYAILHEAFYNMFTKWFGKKEEPAQDAPTPVAVARAAAVMPEPPTLEKSTDAPSSKVSHIAHQAQLAAAPEQALAT